MDGQAFELLRERILAIDHDIKEIKKDVKDMLAFRWQIIGGSVVASLFITIIVQIFALALKN